MTMIVDHFHDQLFGKNTEIPLKVLLLWLKSKA